MASKTKVTKARRTSKQSQGKHGSGGKMDRAFTHVEHILLGKGMYKTFKVREASNRYRGTTEIKEPFDAVQAKLNRALYPWLFQGDY